MSSEVAIVLVAVFAVAACALSGIFLVLRRMAMMSDAISHAILPGLVAGYVAARGPNLAAGLLGGVVAGLVTVVLVEMLTKSKRMKEDSAIGVVFPALFALGVFVISRYFANIHIDADAVLYGEIAMVPFDTLQIGGRDWGPQSLWILGALTLANAAFLGIFYKELKLATFDPGLAAALGFAPGLLHYLLMANIAITTVVSFSAVGAILVVALIIVPAAAASLLTRRLPIMIALSLLIGVLAAWSGYALAVYWDVSISGMIAVMLGVLFGLAFLAAPEQGIVAQAVRRRRQRQRFAAEMLVVHLAHHEGTAEQATECTEEHLVHDLHWPPNQVARTLAQAREAGLIAQHAGDLTLTNEGRELAETVARR